MPPLTLNSLQHSASGRQGATSRLRSKTKQDSGHKGEDTQLAANLTGFPCRQTTEGSRAAGDSHERDAEADHTGKTKQNS